MPHKVRVAWATLITVALILLGLPATGAQAAADGTAETYLVLYQQQAVPASAAGDVAAAGGTLVAAYDAIGVVVARSTSTSFRADIMKDTRVEGAAATTNFGSQVRTDFGTAETAPGDLPNAPATDADSLSGLQWDMRQIHTPEAHAVTGGSPAVVVGDIDTGLDFTHPDLASNYSAADSADCSSGAPLRRTTTTATERTRPGRLQPRRTGSASSAWRRTSASRASSPRTTPASSSRRWSSARSCGPAPATWT